MVHYSPTAPVQVEQISSSSPLNLTGPATVPLADQQGVNMEEISQYYIFSEKSSQSDYIVYDSPDFDIPLDPELPLSGQLSSLQTIFSVREVGNPNYLGVRVPVLTHQDLDLLDSMAIEVAYLTIDAFTTMVKAVGPGALMYKWDLCRTYRQIWTDPFDVPYQGFFWEGAFYFDTVLVMGCTSSMYICQ